VEEEIKDGRNKKKITWMMRCNITAPLLVFNFFGIGVFTGKTKPYDTLL